MSHRRVAIVLSGIALVSLSAVPAMSQSGSSASAQWAPPRTARDILGDRLIRQALDKDTPRTFDPITGNYNSFWLVERELDNRTSLVVDPPDGRIPSLTPAAQRSADTQRAYRREHPADGPEDRRLGDRCLHFGLPKIGSGYNSYHQILQTPDHVTIFSEMAHDARIIPLDTRPNLSHNLRQWNGDARGRWEGDTLVVETTNFSPKSNFRGSRENLRLVERLTRISPDTLEHEITIEDDTTWTSPWTVRRKFGPPGHPHAARSVLLRHVLVRVELRRLGAEDAARLLRVEHDVPDHIGRRPRTGRRSRCRPGRAI